MLTEVLFGASALLSPTNGQAKGKIHKIAAFKRKRYTSRNRKWVHVPEDFGNPL